jgi:hypothetical protein
MSLDSDNKNFLYQPGCFGVNVIKKVKFFMPNKLIFLRSCPIALRSWESQCHVRILHKG